MNKALIFALLAAVISLITVFIEGNAARAKADKSSGTDGNTGTGTDSSDCGSDGGGCD